MPIGTRFSPAEDARMTALRKAGRSWSFIATELRRPSEGCVRARFSKIQSARERLQKPALTTIDCMTCRTPFPSWSRVLNRMCEGCKRRAADAAPLYVDAGSAGTRRRALPGAA